MKHYQKIKLLLLGAFIAIAGVFGFGGSNCFASQLSYSPIRHNRVFVPGSTEDLTIILSAPASDSQEPMHYELEARPFYIDDDNQTHFEAKENYSLITDWITFPEEDRTGILNPGESKEIIYTVNVPKNAPAGGQYAAVIVKTYTDSNNSAIGQIYEMTQAIYAEVAGETIRQGEVGSLNLPTIVTSGNIIGSATIKNLGNVHANAKHVLKVFPLIGNEEFYTNEEKPQENLVMPGASRFTNIAWENTPSIGVFRVVYTVEFEDVKNELSKIVVVCPIWLLFLIVALIAGIIIRIFTSKKKKA